VEKLLIICDNISFLLELMNDLSVRKILFRANFINKIANFWYTSHKQNPLISWWVLGVSGIEPGTWIFSPLLPSELRYLLAGANIDHFSLSKHFLKKSIRPFASIKT
jgi:hypothetical protein